MLLQRSPFTFLALSRPVHLLSFARRAACSASDVVVRFVSSTLAQPRGYTDTLTSREHRVRKENVYRSVNDANLSTPRGVRSPTTPLRYAFDPTDSRPRFNVRGKRVVPRRALVEENYETRHGTRSFIPTVVSLCDRVSLSRFNRISLGTFARNKFITGRVVARSREREWQLEKLQDYIHETQRVSPVYNLTRIRLTSVTYLARSRDAYRITFRAPFTR